jgi:DNA-binding NarL/FixJ family response regulator
MKITVGQKWPTAWSSMAKIRVLLADDHEALVERVRTILCKDFEVVGTVGNGRDAIAEVRRLDPDVLVIDISMPVLDGLQAASQLHHKACRTKVVFLTVHKDQDYVDAAFAAGASGYVTKSHITSDLVPAIREALAGHTYISKSIKP